MIEVKLRDVLSWRAASALTKSSVLTFRKVEPCVNWHCSRMSDRPPVLCSICNRPMTHVRTVWRAFQGDLENWECRPCGVSVSEAVKGDPQDDDKR